MSEVVKKRIARKDVAKVMREVGYNKKNVDSRGGSNIPEDQLAQANENAKSVPSMADAINRATDAVTPTVDAPIKVPIKLEPKKSEVAKKEAVKKPEAKYIPPIVEVEDDIQEPKMVLIDMSDIRTGVTFTGSGWKILDIKLAYAAMVRAFRIKIRDEYRKGIK